MAQGLAHPFGQIFAVTPLGPNPGPPGQFFLRVQTAFISLLDRVIIGQLIHREAATIHNNKRIFNCLRMVFKQTCHFLRGFEMAFGIGKEQAARLLDSAMLADAGQHILQGPPAWLVVVNITGCQKRNGQIIGGGLGTGQHGSIIAQIEMMTGQIKPIADGFFEFGQGFGLGLKGRNDLPIGCRQHII